MQKYGTALNSLDKKGDKYLYRGKLWRIDHPVPSTSKGKKMMVLASKTVAGRKYVKLVHFGAKGYGHNYSEEAKKNYLRRSSGIRNREGKLTRNDRWSANYWARKILWPKDRPATGPKTTRK